VPSAPQLQAVHNKGGATERKSQALRACERQRLPAEATYRRRLLSGSSATTAPRTLQAVQPRSQQGLRVHDVAQGEDDRHAWNAR
jgi:hypothetical protein